MHLFTVLVLASLVSAEELRFLSVYEQDSETSCGYAAAASLLDLYCGHPLSEKTLTILLSRPGSASLGELWALLAAAGLRARSFRIGVPELDAALARGFAPILLHYDRPKGHFALLLGKDSEAYVAADPARGLESLSADDLLGRWSGAAILFEPSELSPAGEALRRKSVATALGRRALLVAPRALASEEDPHGMTAERERIRLSAAGERTVLMRCDLCLQAEDQEVFGNAEIGLEFEFGRGSGIGLGFPFEFQFGSGISYLYPGEPSLSCFLRRPVGALLMGGELGCVLPVGMIFNGETIVGDREGLASLRLDLARVFDPVALGLSLGIAAPLTIDEGITRLWMDGAYLELGCSAREALNERLSIGASATVDLQYSSFGGSVRSQLAFGGLVGIKLGRLGASLGGSRSSSAPLAMPIRVGVSYVLGSGE